MPNKHDRQNESSRRHRTFFKMAATLALLGMVISAYALNHHMEVKKDGFTDAACNLSDTVNCDAAASSEFSEILGLPLPVLGGGYFLGLLFVALAGIYVKAASIANFVAYAALTIAGAGGSIILAIVSVFYLGSVCPSCVLVYLVCGLQLFLAIWHRDLAKNLKHRSQLVKPGIVALAALAFAVLAFKTISSETALPIKAASTNSSVALSAVFHEIPISSSAFSGLGEDYRLGSDEAKVKLVVFSDFQCPACKNMDSNLKEIRREFGEQVLIVFKNYPLDPLCNSGMPGPMHIYACKSASLARCAGRQKKFWQFHDQVFSNQQSLNETKLELWALELGLKQEQIDSCINSSSILEKIKDDVDLGNKLGVNSTPSVYVNGYKFVGAGLTALRSEIDRMLSSP